MATVLSKNFTLDELVYSETARKHHMPNVPDNQVVVNLTWLVMKVLQPLRTWWGKPISIGSGYRCVALNAMVGGVPDSQHVTGEAADLCIDGDKEKGRKWFEWIKKNCEFDQLIWEKNAKTGNYWVHVSYRKTGNRKMVVDGLIKK